MIVSNPGADISLDVFSVLENSEQGELVGNILSGPPVPVTYQLLYGDGGRFQINGDRLEVAAGADLDAETALSHEIIIQGTDGNGLTYEEYLTVDVTNVHELPDIAVSNDSPVSIEEGETANVIVRGVPAQSEPNLLFEIDCDVSESNDPPVGPQADDFTVCSYPGLGVGTHLIDASVTVTGTSPLDFQYGETEVTVEVIEFNGVPVADAGGPYAGNTTFNITITGSGTDPDGDSLYFRWDLDEDGRFGGDFDFRGASFETRRPLGLLPITLEVCDRWYGLGKCGYDSTTIATTAPIYWEEMEPTTRQITGAPGVMTAVGDKLYRLNGDRTFQEFNLPTPERPLGFWDDLALLPAPSGLAGTVIGSDGSGKIHVFSHDANWGSLPVFRVHTYDPAFDTWTQVYSNNTQEFYWGMLTGQQAVQAGPDSSVLHLLLRLNGSPAAIYAWSANDPETFTPVGTIDQSDRNGVYPGQRMAVGANDKIYRIGGQGGYDADGGWHSNWGARLNSEFDPATGITTRKPDMPAIEGAFNGTAVGGPDGNIYYLGGKFDRRFSYNAITDTWFDLPDIGLSAAITMQLPVGALASDGNIYVMENSTGRMIRLRFGGPAPDPNTSTLDSETTSADAGETVIATAAGVNEDGSDGADVAATLSNNTAGSEPAEVYVAVYEENPIATAQGTVFDVGQTQVGGADGGYFDIQVTGADSADSLTVNVYYPKSIDKTIYENNVGMSWYDGSMWRATISSIHQPFVRNKTNDLDETVSGGRLTYTFDQTSSPRITQLSGSVFTFTVDETPPVIITTLSGESISDGWYISDVDVEFEVFEPGSPDSLDISECISELIDFDTAGEDVTCTATSDGGTSIETITVKRDTLAPVFTTTPDDQFIVSDDPAGVVVNFTVAVVEGGSPGIASGISDVVSIPASGSVFPPGATLVSHRATDIAGNTTEIFHLVTVAIVLQIDIQPAQLNTGAKGVLPVVIPGSGGIDVSAIDVATVILNQASPAHGGHIEDANDDGIDDLVLHFPVPDIVIDPEAVDGDLVDLTLTGEINGLPFSAEDSVVIKLAKEKPNSDESGSEGDGGGSGNGKGGQK